MSRSILVSDELDNVGEQSAKRSRLIQRLGSDLSVLLQCKTDLLSVRRIDELLGRRILDVQTRDKIVASDTEKYMPTMRNFQRPGKLHVKIGWPVDQIVQFAKKENHLEALVLGTRALAGVEKFFLGSVSEEVVRHVTRPVFLLGPKAQENEFNLGDNKKINIMVVTDLTKKCRAAETYAVSFAQRTGASITFYYSLGETLHTVQTFAYGAGEAMTAVDDVFQSIKEDAFKTMQKKIDRLKGKGIDCKFHIEEKHDDLVKSALQLAGDNTQLIFMGHRARGLISTAVLGSNLKGMVANAKMPVVVVRSE